MPSKLRTHLWCASICNPFRLVYYILFNPLFGIILLSSIEYDFLLAFEVQCSDMSVIVCQSLLWADTRIRIRPSMCVCLSCAEQISRSVGPILLQLCILNTVIV